MEMQKVTAHIPKALLAEAQEATGAGITETLRQALEKVSEEQRKKKVYEGLLAMEGTHCFSLTQDDINEMREDRDPNQFLSPPLQDERD